MADKPEFECVHCLKQVVAHRANPFSWIQSSQLENGPKDTMLTIRTHTHHITSHHNHIYIVYMQHLAGIS